MCKYIRGIILHDFSSPQLSRILILISSHLGPDSISYNDIKGLETEFAYTDESDERDAPDRILLDPNLSTASVWDNNNTHVETLDGQKLCMPQLATHTRMC